MRIRPKSLTKNVESTQTASGRRPRGRSESQLVQKAREKLEPCSLDRRQQAITPSMSASGSEISSVKIAPVGGGLETADDK